MSLCSRNLNTCHNQAVPEGFFILYNLLLLLLFLVCINAIKSVHCY